MSGGNDKNHKTAAFGTCKARAEGYTPELMLEKHGFSSATTVAPAAGCSQAACMAIQGETGALPGRPGAQHPRIRARLLTGLATRRTIRLLRRGGVPKRSTGADCKSAGSAFAGSNPAPSTSFLAEGAVRQLYKLVFCKGCAQAVRAGACFRARVFSESGQP